MKKNILFIVTLALVLTFIIQLADLDAGNDDFLAYWSAARSLVTGSHPYNHLDITKVEQSANPELLSQEDLFLNTWNPPWLILLFVPLGILPFTLATNVWVFFNIVLLGLALIFSWHMSSGIESSRGILYVYVACYLFGITIDYISIGQITVLVLLGILLSIWWINQKRDFLAGAILLLPIIKPQVAFFFLLILFIWIIQNRRWNIVKGFVIALLSSLLIFWIIYSNWVTDYLSLLQTMPFRVIYTSTLGSFMDSIFHTKVFYFSAILLIFFIKPILRIVNRDGLFSGANIALLITLPISPFGFAFDQIVILPAIVQIISWLWKRRFACKTIRIIIAVLAVFYIIVYGMLVIPKLEYYWFFILPILFLPIYLIPWKLRYES